MQVIDGSPQDIWAPVDGTSTVIVGQLLVWTGWAVAAAATASGVGDTSQKQVLMGIAIGTNNRTPVVDSTTGQDQIVGVNTLAAQNLRDFWGAESMFAKGDPQPLVKVALINQNTIIRAPIYNSSFGTAPSVLTVTTGSGTGVGFTSNACDFTPVANICTSYCRTGANGGLYRNSTDTSTTVETNTRAFKAATSVGDTFIRVPYRLGVSYAQITSAASFLDCSVSPATNYFIINVLKLNLQDAGNEYAEFTFAPCHFDLVRA